MWTTTLNDRRVLSVTGEDSSDFLQGLVSNDVRKATATHSIYSALLTPQGKFLYDFFAVRTDDGFLLDTHESFAKPLAETLLRFKLRSRITITSTDMKLQVVWGTPPAGFPQPQAGETRRIGGGFHFCDPRHPQMGVRLISPQNVMIPGVEVVEESVFDLHRLTLGIPDGAKDMVRDKDILLELGFEELHGVDFDKGCYMGQELTARTKYRSLIKKHLCQVSAADGSSALPPALTPIMDGQTQVGEMRSSQGHVGLAMLRDEPLALAHPLEAASIPINSRTPAWRPISST